MIGEIATDAARALIESTRALAGASVPDGAAVAGTAIVVSRMDGSESRYLVSWGKPDGESTVAIEARLRNGGDARDPRDWEATIFEPQAAN